MKLIFRQFIFLLFSAVIVMLAVMALFLDVQWLHNEVKETSITEISQASILAAIVCSNLFQAVRSREGKRGFVLIAGFFGCMLIREMDFVFDMIAHGSWLWFALSVAIGTIFFCFKKPSDTIHQLTVFIRHPAYGMMFSGLLCVLVFSRLFGMQVLWQDLMRDGYIRSVKNIVEEGTELFGYALCLISTFWFMARSNEKKAL
ncbi:hypothetical protein HC231_09770 [Brenneria izadpanahii]|uniref:Transporter n=2 Tax=Brenneria izadpanahii TaxID=2722756 RepID=A0ABX7V1M1_9GAMM|nr:hypothetical protein HC231_09770 [Brenneria izadpanahii]